MFSLEDEEDVETTPLMKKTPTEEQVATTSEEIVEELSVLDLWRKQISLPVYDRKTAKAIFTVLHQQYKDSIMPTKHKAILYHQGLVCLDKQKNAKFQRTTDSESIAKILQLENSKVEENIIFKNFLQEHNVQSEQQRRYIKQILDKLVLIFPQESGSEDSAVCPRVSRIRLIGETLESFIRIFSPSLQYSTFQYLEEWKALIAYHCPILYRRFISHLPSQGHYAPLCNSFIRSCSDEKLVIELWDQFIIQQNKFLPYFFSIAILVYYKDHLLKSVQSNDSSNDIVQVLNNLTVESKDQVSFLIETAVTMFHRTPKSIIEYVERAESPGGEYTPKMKYQNEMNCDIFFPGTHCMLIPVSELCGEIYLEEFAGEGTESKSLRFIVIDCRNSIEFEQGQIPNSMNLQAEMLHENPEEADRCVTTIQEYRNSRHFVLAGSENEVLPVLMYLFQHNIPHLSVLHGGYCEFHRQAIAHNLPIQQHSPQCYLCHPKQLAVKKFIEITKETGTALMKQSTTRIESWLQQFNEQEQEEEMPPSNIINNPNLKAMLFNLANPLIFCRRILNNKEVRSGALLLTDRLIIWLENCSLSNEQRQTIEFGYSYAYSLLHIRKITVLQRNYVRVTLGTPQEPEIMSLHFSFLNPDTMEAINLIKTRAQQLVQSIKEQKTKPQSTNEDK